jgi:hypothetical protein
MPPASLIAFYKIDHIPPGIVTELSSSASPDFDNEHPGIN